jgi:hypothetical protein
MSESAPEPDSQPAARSSGSGVFTRKLGPLPMWAWMGVALAVALAYYFIKQDKAKASAASSTTGSSTTAGTGDTGTTGTTDSSLIPQFVNQTYVQGSPPSAPGLPGPAGPTGATGATGAPAPAAAQVNQYPAPTKETVSKLSNTTAKVMWNYITTTTPKPASYTIAAYTTNGKLAQQITVASPDTSSGQGQATLSGLTAGTKYNIQVWANGGKVAPPGSLASITM